MSRKGTGVNGQTRSINHLLLGAAGSVIIIAGLRAGTDLLNPILLAAFLTAVTNPAVEPRARGGTAPG